MRLIWRMLKIAALGAAVTVAVMVLAIPVTLAMMLARFHERQQAGIPEGPLEELLPGDEPSMTEIFGRLESVPFNPRKVVGMVKAGLNNSFLLFLNARRDTAARMYRYPPEFEEVVFESFDGTPIAGILGLHADGKPRPGLVISHGFMGSKNDHYIIDLALTAYASWGFNVLGVDLRNFGRSQCLQHSPTTAGWKEGEDLLAAAKFLSEKDGVTSVGITGFSMGAGSTMRAAYMSKEYPYLTGGAIAWNGYSDARRMVEYISTKPEPLHPFYPVYQGFRLMHKLRREDMKGYIENPEHLRYLDGTFGDADFVTYVEKIAAPHYGVESEEYFRNASSREYLSEIEVPLLVIHAADDPICPADEMDILMELAEDNPNVDVWMLPAGNHCMFGYLDPEWYEAVLRGFFTYWAKWE